MAHGMVEAAQPIAIVSAVPQELALLRDATTGPTELDLGGLAFHAWRGCATCCRCSR